MTCLVGPVFFYDLVRTARRARSFLIRAGYALVLLFALLLLYLEWLARGTGTLWGGLGSPLYLSRNEVAKFASTFYYTFFALQFLAILFLTPIFTSTAIAEERLRGTLDDLLLSDISSVEIVLGKLASRLISLFYVLLGGLPVLGTLQMAGGIDPNLVVGGFVASAFSLLSLGSLGIWCSVRSDRPRAAIMPPILWALAFLGVTALLGNRTSPLYSPSFWLGSGNIVQVFRHLQSLPGGITGPAVAEGMAQYALVHTVLAGIFLRMAIRQLRRRDERSSARSESLRGAFPAALGRRPRGLSRPRIGEDPVLWREMHQERGRDLPLFLRWILIFAVSVACLVLAVFYLSGILVGLTVGRVSQFASLWVQIVATPILCLSIMGAALRAAVSLSSERDQQTLDALLATPLEDQEILTGKGLGSLWSVREGWVLAAIVWLLGMVAGGVHLISLLMLTIASIAYAWGAVGVGLWFSLVSRNPLRATVWTLLTLVLVGTGRPLLWLIAYPLAALGQGLFGISPRWANDLANLALTPPGTLVTLSFPFGDWYSFPPQLAEGGGAIGLAWVGVCVYGLAALGIWAALKWRFPRVTGRLR